MKLTDALGGKVDGSEITALSALSHGGVLAAKGRRLILLHGVAYDDATLHCTKTIVRNSERENGELILSNSAPSPITSIVTSPLHPGTVVIAGGHFVYVVTLPSELHDDTSVVAELLQTKYFCECTAVHESAFAGDAAPVQVRLTTLGEEKRPFLAVLAEDCAIRFYDIEASQGLEYPKVKVDLLSMMATLTPAHNKRSYGLFKTIVSFVIVESVTSGWHVICLDSHGDAHAVFASSIVTIPHVVDPLDLKELNLDICVLEMIPHDHQDLFVSMLGVTTQGVVAHLMVLTSPAYITGVKVVDTLALPDITSISAISSGSAALLQSPSALFYADIAPSIDFIRAVASGEPSPVWAGMVVTECIGMPRGESSTFCVSPVAVECGRRIPDGVEGESVAALLTATKTAPHYTVLTRLTAAIPSTSKSSKGIVRASKGDKASVSDQLKKLMTTKKPPLKHVSVPPLIGTCRSCSHRLSSSSSEADLLASLQASVQRTHHNVELLRNAVHLVSQLMVDAVGRAHAIERGRSEEDARILRVYEGLAAFEHRVHDQRSTTDALISRANHVWNSLAGRGMVTEKELTMLGTLKDRSSQLHDLQRSTPELSLDMESFRRALSTKNHDTAHSFARITNINNMFVDRVREGLQKEEIASLRERAEEVEAILA